MTRFRVRAALLFALSGLLLILLPFASGRASDLPGAVTGVKIEQKTADQYQAVTVDIKFAIPPGAKTGDTFAVTLPKSLYAQNQTFPLRAPDGSLVATGVIKNGVVTFTLTDYVEKHDHTTGTAKISAHFNQAQITPGKTNDFDFTSGGKDFHSPVVITKGVSPTHNGPHKIGVWTDPEDQGSTKPTDAVHWRVQSAFGPYTNLKFTDTLGPGQVNDCATISVVSSTTFRADGGLQNPKPLGPRAVVSCLPNSTSFLITVASVKTGEVVQVSYDTTITDQSLASFTNEVHITAKGYSRSLSWKLSHYGAYGQGSGVVVTTPPTTSASPSTTSRTTVPTTTGSSGVLGSTTSRSASTTASATTTARTTASSGVLGSTTSRSGAAATTTSSALAFTGSPTGPLSELAGVLLLGGSALLLLGRRRGTHEG